MHAQGSNDGSVWVTLDTVSGSNTFPSATRGVVTNDAFAQFRWVFPQNGYVEIYEVEVYGCLGGAPSASFTPVHACSCVRVSNWFYWHCYFPVNFSLPLHVCNSRFLMLLCLCSNDHQDHHDHHANNHDHHDNETDHNHTYHDHHNDRPDDAQRRDVLRHGRSAGPGGRGAGLFGVGHAVLLRCVCHCCAVVGAFV